MKRLLIACAFVACHPAPARTCAIAGGWELGSHDPTDRSTNVYVTEKGALEEDVRRADGTHGWEVLDFAKEGCHVAPACDVIRCASYTLVDHFCDLAGEWHGAHITTHRDDVDIELPGKHLKALRFTAGKLIVSFPEGDERCDVSARCDAIHCQKLHLDR